MFVLRDTARLQCPPWSQRGSVPVRDKLDSDGFFCLLQVIDDENREHPTQRIETLITASDGATLASPCEDDHAVVFR